MRTVIVNIPNNNAFKLLRDLELNKVLSIVKDPAADSYALPGDPLSILDFKKWIKEAESMPAVSLPDAKVKWEQKKKQLERLTR